MTKVTREMIAAAHDVTMQHKIVLGHELLTEIYQAMDAKREFVGLTDEERDSFWKADQMTSKEWDELFNAIEAKLREKNAQPSKPLTDEQFLEMILRTGTQELVGVTTFVGGSIQMHGKTGLLRSAKIIKEFVEAAHGIMSVPDGKGDA